VVAQPKPEQVALIDEEILRDLDQEFPKIAVMEVVRLEVNRSSSVPSCARMTTVIGAAIAGRRGPLLDNELFWESDPAASRDRAEEVR
jgi:hypothetical protein